MYRQDCETFGMVVKMLVAKDPNLEKQLQVPLRENLGEIRERCLEDLKHFISELDEVVRQPEPSTCDSSASSASLSGHKLSKTAVNHSSSYWRISPVWDGAWRLDCWESGLLSGTYSATVQPGGEKNHGKTMRCLWMTSVIFVVCFFLMDHFYLQVFCGNLLIIFFPVKCCQRNRFFI